jgi:hypothetical protein
MNAKIFKFRSGDEMIAAVDDDFDENNQKFEAKNPMMILPKNNNEISFLPWMMFAKQKEFPIYSVDLLFPPVDANEEISDLYDSIVSKIMLPPKKQIITG